MRAPCTLDFIRTEARDKNRIAMHRRCCRQSGKRDDLMVLAAYLGDTAAHSVDGLRSNAC